MLGLRGSGGFEIIWKRSLEKVITYSVVEKFVSVNGEGQRAGVPAAFIRFAGCNLCCSYCDTRWANEAGARTEELTVEDILAFVRDAQVACVTLTGGEPTLQPGLLSLVEALLYEGGPQGQGLWIEIETNGSVDLAPFVLLRKRLEMDSKMRGILSLTVDYKLPTSGVEAAMLVSNYATLDEYDTVKFVCGSLGDLDRAREVCDAYSLSGCVAVFFSPVFGDIQPSTIVDYLLKYKMNWAHVQVQLHKVIWPNIEKGV